MEQHVARRPHRPESGDKVRRQSIRHLRSSDVEQSANDSQKFQHLVKVQICFEVSLVYLTILEAAPTLTIGFTVMAPYKLSYFDVLLLLLLLLLTQLRELTRSTILARRS